MPKPRRRTAVVALAAALALGGPLLAGCSLLHPGGGTGISVPGLSAGTGHLPKDWPSGVPVAKGDVVSGAALGTGKDETWNATIKVDGPQAADAIATQLTGAGFTANGDASATTDQGSVAAFTSSTWDVAVVVTKAGKEGWVANYTIHAADGGSGGN